MTEVCEKCENVEHNGDSIDVDGKAFCPNTLERIWTEDEAEAMTEIELAKVKQERIKLVQPAKYVIIKVKGSKK